MNADEVVATYDIQSFLPVADAASALVGEQSTGTFVDVPGETDELRRRHGARVLAIDEIAPMADALPGALRPTADAPLRAGRVRVAFPLENFGPSLPNLLTAVAGNLFELRELAGVRLMDLELPPAFASAYPGPRFGVSGTRDMLGIPEEPLLGTIIKPNVGLSPTELGEVVRDLVTAGVDFIKDDELTANPPYSPLTERVAVVTRELDRHAQRTGRQVMYAFNISDEIDAMLRHAEVVRAAGGTCVMVCVNIVGLPAVSHLAGRAGLPVHGHRAMLGATMRHPGLGIHFTAYQKLARLAGVDHLHTSGFGNKFFECDDDVQSSIRAVQQPLLGGYETLPVLSSGQWAGTVAPTWRKIGNRDVLLLAGGGILGHPDGASAGVESIRAAWRAAVDDVPLAEAAAGNPALAAAVRKFGPVADKDSDGR